MIDVSKRRLLASAATVPAALIAGGALSAAGQTGKDPDPCTAPCNPVTPGERSAGVTPSNTQYAPGDVRRYGAAVSAASGNSRAIQAAIAAVAKSGGGVVQLPPGTMKCESDLRLDARVVLQGHQFGSHLQFAGAGLLLDARQHTGPKRGLDYCGIHDVRVSRTGAPGYAVRLIGHGGAGGKDNRNIVRFDIRRLQIFGSTGGGLEMRGVIIGKVDNLMIQNCAGPGLLMDQQEGKNRTSVNAVSFVGGEIQNCRKAAEFNRLRAVAFYAIAFEGNDEGVDLRRGVAVSFDTCYFEANGNYDLRIGEGADYTFAPVTVRTSTFYGKKDYGIRLSRGTNVSIDSCFFSGYLKAGIVNAPRSAGAVSGLHRNCVATGDTPRVADGEDRFFHQDPLETVLTVSFPWDAESIGAGTMRATDVAVKGAAPGDFVMVSSSGDLKDLALSAYVSAVDNVRLMLTNNTRAAIRTARNTYRIVVWRGKPAWF